MVLRIAMGYYPDMCETSQANRNYTKAFGINGDFDRFALMGEQPGN